MFKKLIGTKKFYKRTLMIAFPFMIQNAVTNLVTLLDNVMIGRVGTNALSGVAIANQLIFVFTLLLMGATAGVGIFTAQFYGKGDTEGVRYTFRMKLVLNTFACLITTMLLTAFANQLINLFLQGEGLLSDARETLIIGKEYLMIMLIGLFPTAITSAYAGTLRDTGQTEVPMKASVLAIIVNLTGNMLLIYGLLGFPRLGAVGAAIATVISRFVEVIYLIVYTERHKEEHEFIIGAFKSMYVPGALIKNVILKTLPLMVNETLWSVGMSAMIQCYSYKSLDAVAALNIKTTFFNLIGVAFMTMGEAISIIVGQILGSGEIEEAKDTAKKLIAFTFSLGIVFGTLMILLSPFFPMLYNTSESVRHLATQLIILYALQIPALSITHSSYFTIRAGGNVFVTILFDSCYVWLVSVPAAFCVSHFTALEVLWVVAVVEALEVFKSISGLVIVKSGVWAKKIV